MTLERYMRIAVAVLTFALVVAGCTPTITSTANYPEHIQTTQCFSGGYAFSINLVVPREYGRVLAATQHEDGANGLTSVCRLVGDGRFFEVFTGEVSGGNSGLCVSLRTQNAGHVISCASRSDVRRAINASQGSTADVINLTQWRAFPS